MLGLMVAFIGVWLTHSTGILVFDGMASVIIGIILVGTAIWLAYETKGLLIGESANKWVIQGIRELLHKQASIEHVNEVLTMHMGPGFILANISVDFVDDMNMHQLEANIEAIDSSIKTTFPQIKRVFIEAEKRKHIISQETREPV
jgi:divalent metal cation (Fe/Co/Zn/Cd) transporter